MSAAMTASSAPLLELSGVHTHIAAYHILHGVHLVVPRGEVTMLLGRNGAGKTTTLRTIMGLWRASFCICGRIRGPKFKKRFRSQCLRSLPERKWSLKFSLGTRCFPMSRPRRIFARFSLTLHAWRSRQRGSLCNTGFRPKDSRLRVTSPLVSRRSRSICFAPPTQASLPISSLRTNAKRFSSMRTSMDAIASV